jgi:hypothetical protein
MVRAIKETVTVGEGGRIEIPHSELPAGSKADVIVTLNEPAVNGHSSVEGAPPGGDLAVVKREFKLPEEADAYLEYLRKEWDADEERRRPISYYFGKAKGGFKDAAEADAFIRAERDAWEG